MRRGAKPAKAKIEAPRKDDGSKIRDLDKRLAEALKREAEAQEQQAATAEILRVIGTSPTDTRPVFTAIARSAASLCSAQDVFILRTDGAVMRLAAGIGPLSVGGPADFAVPLTRGSVSGRAVVDQRTLHIRDLAAERDDEFPVGKDLQRRFGHRTMLAVPLLRDRRALGVICVLRTEIRPFTDSQIELLRTFADQAVIAIENVRLFTELQEKNEALTQAHAQVAEALEQQTATADILRVIAASPTDLTPVLNTVVESAARFCGSEDASLFQLDGDTLRQDANYGPVGDIAGFRVPVVRGTVGGRTVLERRAIHVTDTQAEVEDFPEASAISRRVGHRTILSVPLLREGTPIGVLQLRRAEVNPFTDKQIALLQTFADQAVIAIENVRLFTELQQKNQALTRAHAQVTEALEQQTATAEILRVISRSPTDIRPVFDTIVRNARRLCEADSSSVFTYRGDLIHLESIDNATLEGADAIRRAYPLPPSRGHATGRAILTGRPIHIPDVRQDPEYELYGILGAGLRSIVSVPMLRDGMAIGTITLHTWATPRPFSDAQISLLQTFADQAVIAIENVRLFNETTEALEQQKASAEILGVISSSPTDVQPVFDVIVQSAVRLCGGLHSNVYLVEDGLMHLVAHHNFSPAALEHLQRRFPMPVSQAEGFAARVIREGVLVHLHDAQTDPEVPEMTRRTTQALGARSVLYVPMLRDRVAIGGIVVSRSEVKPFSAKEIALIRTFADQAVIAIENVRLFTELQEKNRALTEALEQQTATAEILRVISSSPGDIQPVFDAIAANATRLCDAINGLVIRFDGQLLHLAAHYNVDPERLAAVRQAYPRPPSRGALSGRAILTRDVVHVPDVSKDPEYLLPVATTIGYRSVLAVPMMHEGVPRGTILVARDVVAPFSDTHIALIRTFADQAVIAIENVRLFKELGSRNAELSETLARQMATGEVLRGISRAPTDTQPVFDIIATSARRLCDAIYGQVQLRDGDLLRLAALDNVDPDSTAAIQRAHPLLIDEGNLGGRVVRQCSVVRIPDLLDDPTYQYKSAWTGSGVRSLLGVPMLRDGAPIGVIAVGRATPGLFSDKQVELLETFADQAVIAIENVRLFNELEARTAQLTRSVEELTALGDVGRALSATLDLDAVLQTIVTRASQLAGTDACSVFEYDEATEAFHLRATHNLDEEVLALARHTPVRKGEGVQGRMAITRQPVQIPDIAAEDAYRGPMRDILLRTGTRALLAIPMLREDQLIGGFTVAKKTPGEFSREVIELLTTFATQSALAIQNARLFREIADKSRQLELASQHKSEFLANMSHELRTPLNAIIGFSEVLTERMFGELNEKQEEYLKDIYASGQHLLSLINDILDLSKIEAGRMELELTDFDLPQAIENALMLVRDRAARRSIALHHAVDERLGQIRGDQRKIKQVLLNLLSNALKFTPEGGRVDVQARLVDGRAEISVTDTGVGIAPEDQEAVFEEFRQVGTADKKVEGTGLGLTLSRKLIELHGGRIWVQSQVGVGSTFTFTLPLTH
jgi:GAF domain-containing protein